tara:strand:- start:283 stop:507 length:225 start_codon:yes stop_codon:yes gene_type:complete
MAVTITRDAIDSLASRWPCNGIPDQLDRIVFETDCGDLVALDFYDRDGKIVDVASMDIAAVLALIEDAEEKEED